MTLEEYKVQQEMLWDEYNMVARSYYFATKPEDKTTFWTMRNEAGERILHAAKEYWAKNVITIINANTKVSTPVTQEEQVAIPPVESPKPIDGRHRSPQNTHHITINGRTHTINEWAKETGIKRGTLYYRLFILGWNPEDAISKGKYGMTMLKELPTPKAEKPPKRTAAYNLIYVPYKGSQKTLQELVDLTGLPRQTLYSRIFQLGWSAEEAVNKPLVERRKLKVREIGEQSKHQTMITAFGKTQPLRSWAQEKNIHRETLYSRIFALNWSPEEALTRTARKITYGKRKNT